MRSTFLVLPIALAAGYALHSNPLPADAPVSIALTERNNGGTVLLAEDGSMRIKLYTDAASNAFWVLADASTQSVQMAGKPTLAGLTAKKAKPYQTFSFKGLAEGTTVLSFRQVRNNQRSAADPVYTVTVRVLK